MGSLDLTCSGPGPVPCRLSSATEAVQYRIACSCWQQCSCSWCQPCSASPMPSREARFSVCPRRGLASKELFMRIDLAKHTTSPGEKLETSGTGKELGTIADGFAWTAWH